MATTITEAFMSESANKQAMTIEYIVDTDDKNMFEVEDYVWQLAYSDTPQVEAYVPVVTSIWPRYKFSSGSVVASSINQSRIITDVTVTSIHNDALNNSVGTKTGSHVSTFKVACKYEYLAICPVLQQDFTTANVLAKQSLETAGYTPNTTPGGDAVGIVFPTGYSNPVNVSNGPTGNDVRGASIKKPVPRLTVRWNPPLAKDSDGVFRPWVTDAWRRAVAEYVVGNTNDSREWPSQTDAPDYDGTFLGFGKNELLCVGIEEQLIDQRLQRFELRFKFDIDYEKVAINFGSINAVEVEPHSFVWFKSTSQINDNGSNPIVQSAEINELYVEKMYKTGDFRRLFCFNGDVAEVNEAAACPYPGGENPA